MNGMRGRRYRARGLAVLTSLVLGVSGCGEATPAPDLGPYSTARAAADYDGKASAARGILVESLRIGERLVFAQQIDSDLTHGRGGGVIVDHAGASGPLSPAARTALQPFEVLGGYSAVAGNSAQLGQQPGKSLTVTVLALPSDELAVAAAQAMAAADFGSEAGNSMLAIPNVLAAQGYWQSRVKIATAWTTWKSLVLVVNAKFENARASQLVDMLDRTVKEQVSGLSGFMPTRSADLPNLKMDPDELLTDLVRTGTNTPDKLEFAVYGPRAYALLLDRPSQRLSEYREFKVDAVAVAHNNQLFRAEDGDAADSLQHAIESELKATGYESMDAGAGVTGVPCYRATQPDARVIDARHYACLLRHGAYVWRINGNQEVPVRQMAAAQAALSRENR